VIKTAIRPLKPAIKLKNVTTSNTIASSLLLKKKTTE
jgi:hypothetical protein